ncbi:MAG: 3-deoxy-D-manno-octulosonic acid transferase [Rhodobacteraceae bacterium]|nr:3-deoxy-D-manno-octulosonic acid transferase [Paracoccaceae bacterium]
MGRSLGLAAYLTLSARLLWLARWIFRRRLKTGKEDGDRIGERFGRSGTERPPGRLVWFHAASIGEVVSLLELVRQLGERRQDLSFLMTTGTLTSAEILKSRMPARAIHQFVPYDVLPAVSGFLDHWRPDLGIWTESELWPTLICETHRRNIPLLYINARMSSGSFRRWLWLPAFAGSILNRFAQALVQDEETAARLKKLGLEPQRMRVLGSLKRGSAELPCDERARRRFEEAAAGRGLWLAASTHDGEEELIAAAQRELLRRAAELLCVIVPRHPERGPQIAEQLRGLGHKVSLRSVGGLPQPDDQFYIADTLGELGLWYRVATVSFLGGSLVEAGGHNPTEPALLASAILHGPHVTNFATEFNEMTEAGASMRIETPVELARAVEYALLPDHNARLTEAAARVTEGGKQVTGQVASVILGHLPPESA